MPCVRRIAPTPAPLVGEIAVVCGEPAANAGIINNVTRELITGIGNRLPGRACGEAVSAACRRRQLDGAAQITGRCIASSSYLRRRRRQRATFFITGIFEVRIAVMQACAIWLK